MIQRSNDDGENWEAVGNEFNYDGVPGTHQWYDGTQHPWEFKRVWHLEPSLADPETVYAGSEDAALFKTTDGGRTWKELAGVRSVKGHLWQPGAGGMGCIPSFWTPTGQNGFSSRSRRPAYSGQMIRGPDQERGAAETVVERTET